MSVVQEAAPDEERDRRSSLIIDELTGLVDGAPVPLWRARTTGRIVYANRAFRSRFGEVPVVAAIAVLGDRARAEAAWLEIVARGGEHSLVVAACDGTTVRLGCRVIPGDDTAPARVVGWADTWATDAPVERWEALAAELSERPGSPLRR